MRVRIIISVYLLLLSSHIFASSYKFYKEVLHVHGREAREAHDKLKLQSKNSSFLNCPIELIENQWGGSESVLAGVEHLSSFIAESRKAKPDFNNLINQCQENLEKYKNLAKKKHIHSGPILDEELSKTRDQIITVLANEKKSLREVVFNALNAETRCYTKRVAVEASVILGGSAGYYRMECTTPLGRRFRLHGSSLGFGLGFMMGLSTPNAKGFNDPITYSFNLYQEPEKALHHESHYVGNLAFVGGAAIEHDRSTKLRHGKSGLQYKFDLRPSIGGGFMAQEIHNFMSKKDLNPLYISLSEVLDLRDFALSDEL